MMQLKIAPKQPGMRLSIARQKQQPGYLKKEMVLRVQNASWERDLARLQKKLRKYSGHRSLTDELIEERRHEA